jgi:Ca-activated chloride channel family protein
MWQKSKFEVDRIKAGQPAKIGLLVEVKAPEMAETVTKRNPQAVVFVVDRSGSMGNGRLDLVKDSIGELVGRLSPTDYLSIVSFDTEIETHVPMQPVGITSAQKIRRDLATLEPRGGTNIELGYVAGLQEAAKAPEGIERLVILLSDGEANSGIQDPAQLGQVAAFATEHLVKTSTIGIGEGFDERILSAIAGSGQGNHFAAVKLDEAVAGLQDEIDGLLQRTLTDLTCMVEVTDKSKQVWVHPLGYIKSKVGHLGGLTVSLSDMAAGEERGFAFVLDISAVADIGTLEFKTVVTATDVRTGLKVDQNSLITINIADPVGFVNPARDEDVVAEILAYRLTDIKALAADAAYRGDFEEARRLIREAQGETTQLLRHMKTLSPRLRKRLTDENNELGELLNVQHEVLSKRANESSYRSARSKQDPRKK